MRRMKCVHSIGEGEDGGALSCVSLLEEEAMRDSFTDGAGTRV